MQAEFRLSSKVSLHEWTSLSCLPARVVAVVLQLKSRSETCGTMTDSGQRLSPSLFTCTTGTGLAGVIVLHPENSPNASMRTPKRGMTIGSTRPVLSATAANGVEETRFPSADPKRVCCGLPRRKTGRSSSHSRLRAIPEKMTSSRTSPCWAGISNRGLVQAKTVGGLSNIILSLSLSKPYRCRQPMAKHSGQGFRFPRWRTSRPSPMRLPHGSREAHPFIQYRQWVDG